MKKVIYLLAASAFLLHSCGNSQASDKSKTNPETAVTENPSEMVAAQAEVAGNSESASQDTTAKPKGGTILIGKNDFLKKVWNYQSNPQQWVFLGDKPAIIDFYADWCGPCRIASPILEEVSQEYAGKIDVYKIDTQKEQELAAVFGISSIPAFLYIPKNGKPVMAAGIGRSKEETKNMFKENISKILLITN